MRQFAFYLNFDMEYILKLSAVCIVSATFTLLIKKVNSEIALLIGTCTAIFCVFSAIEIYREIDQYLQQWQTLSMLKREYFVPLFKCLGISIVSQLGCNVCKDAGQSAVAAALDFCGNIGCVLCLLPLINHMLNLLKSLL